MLGRVSHRGDEDIGVTIKEKQKEQFRDYDSDVQPSVREFYRLNHLGQTLEFVRPEKEGASPAGSM
jgi:hypothetical protein